MKKNNNIMQDDKLKDLFSSSAIKAGENLKYRIMQQIQTESALAKREKKEKKINNQIRIILTLAIVMYALIAGVAGTVYFSMGRDALLTPEFIMIAVFITVITTVFGAISYFDTNLRVSKKKRYNNTYR